MGNWIEDFRRLGTLLVLTNATIGDGGNVIYIMNTMP